MSRDFFDFLEKMKNGKVLCLSAFGFLALFRFFGSMRRRILFFLSCRERSSGEKSYPLARGVGMLFTALCDTLIFREKITKGLIVELILIFAAIVLTNL